MPFKYYFKIKVNSIGIEELNFVFKVSLNGPVISRLTTIINIDQK